MDPVGCQLLDRRRGREKGTRRKKGGKEGIVGMGMYAVVQAIQVGHYLRRIESWLCYFGG